MTILETPQGGSNVDPRYCYTEKKPVKLNEGQVVDVTGLFLDQKSQMSTIQSSAINLQRTLPLRNSRGVITTIKKRRDGSSESRANVLSNATF